MVSNPFSGQGLVINISADSGNLQRELATAATALSNFEKQAIGVGVALMGISTGAFAYTIATVSDFENSMINSLSISGNMSEKMEGQFYDMARSIARELPFAASEIADGFYYLASAGLSAEQQLAAMPAIAQFATATQMDLAQASDVATNVMSAMGLEAEDLNWVMDQLTGTVTGHNTTAEQLGGALANAAPTAAMLGIELHELNAYIGALADVGISGTKAGTLLRSMMVELSDPTGKAATKLNELGIETHDAQGNMLPMIDILGDMEAAGLGTADVFDIFGRQGGQAAAILLQTGVPALQEYMDAIEDTGGLTQEVAEYQMQSFHNQVELLKTSIADVAIETGMALLPALKALIGILSIGVDVFGRINRATNGWLGAILMLGTFLAGLVLTIGGLASAAGGLAVLLAPLIGAFQFLATVVSVLTSPAMLLAGAKLAIAGAAKVLIAVLAALLSPIGLLIGAIVLLGAMWATNFGGIRDHTMRVVEAIQDVLAPVFEAFGGQSVDILGLISDAWSLFMSVVEPIFAVLFEWLADVLIWAIYGLADVVAWAIPIIVAGFEWLADGVAWLGEVFTAVFEAAGAAIEWFQSSVIQPFVDWFGPIWEENVGQVIEEAGATWAVYAEAVEIVIDWITQKVAAFVEWFTPYWTAWLDLTKAEWERWSGEILAIWEWWTTTTKENFDEWVAGWLELWHLVSGDVLAVVDFFTAALTGYFEWAFTAITTAANIFFALLRLDWQTAFVYLYDFLVGTFDGIVSFITDWGGRLLTRIGEIVSGVLDWFRNLATRLIGNSIIPDMLAAILTAFTSFGASLVTWVSTFAATLISRWVAFVTRFYQTIATGLTQVYTAFTSFGSRGLSWLASFVATLISRWVAFVARFYQTIATGLTRVFSALTSFGSRGLSWLTSFVATMVSRWVAFVTRFYQTIATGLTRVFAALTSFGSRGLSWLASFVSNMVSRWVAFVTRFYQIISTVLTRIISAIVSFGSRAVSQVVSIAGRILSTITSLGSRLYTAGRDLMAQLANGIKNAASRVTGAVENVIGRVKRFLPGSDAETGPLSSLEADSFAIPETLANQMLDGRRLVSQAANEMVEAATISPNATMAMQFNAEAASNRDAIEHLERELGSQLGTLIEEVRNGDAGAVRLDGRKVGEIQSDTMNRKAHRWEVTR